MELFSVQIKKPAEVNFILAQSHFIKTVEDVHETLAESMPGIKFGLAFCESSGDRKIRHSGTDDEMVQLAIENAQNLAAGHSLLIFLKGAYSINVLNRLKQVSEIATIFCASANPVEVILCKIEQGNGILGVVDGGSPLGIEDEQDKEARKSLLRQFGYKL
jgi:hypothetical protein